MKLLEPLSISGRDMYRNIILIQVSKMLVQNFKARWSWMLKVRPAKVFATRH